MTFARKVLWIVNMNTDAAETAFAKHALACGANTVCIRPGLLDSNRSVRGRRIPGNNVTVEASRDKLFRDKIGFGPRTRGNNRRPAPCIHAHPKSFEPRYGARQTLGRCCSEDKRLAQRCSPDRAAELLGKISPRFKRFYCSPGSFRYRYRNAPR
jgi:hypothetical protein